MRNGGTSPEGWDSSPRTWMAPCACPCSGEDSVTVASSSEGAVATLSKDEIVTITILKKQGESQRAIARRFGINEKAVRYHLKRQSQGAVDRRAKPALIERLGLSAVVEYWWSEQRRALPADRNPNIEVLYDLLVEQHGFTGSVKAVRKYARLRLPQARLRPYRRVETPPGAQAQADWSEHPGMDIGDAAGRATLYAFHLKLSHSRAEAVVWCRAMDQVNWHHAHNVAFQRLGGVPAVVRIDNLKTGVVRGAGPWGTLNPAYAAYAHALGFHIDPCLPRRPEHKGKVERGVLSFRGWNPGGGCFTSLEHLQAWTDARIAHDRERRRCPATGSSIAAAWAVEQRLLRSLPDLMPEPFDVVVTRVVGGDCRVAFEGRFYPVPFAHVGLPVEVRGCAGTVQIVDPITGLVLRSHQRHTPERNIIDPTCYEGPATERVLPPLPLGAMARRLDELGRDGIERRSIELYAALAEVAR